MAGTRRHDQGFTVQQTHGILLRSDTDVIASSDALGWPSIYASLQHERPYEDDFAAVDDHLIILHLNGPVGVSRRLGQHEERRVVPPGGLFILPGGADFGVRLEGELDSLHVYLRRDLVQEVAEDLGIRDGRADILPSLGEPDPLAERLALGVRDALLAGDGAAGVYADYLSRALAARLLREHAPSSRQAEQTPGALTPPQLRTATDFIEANLDRSITLRDMAAACGLSPTHFARRFKLAVGVPPHQRLMQMRVERAKRLLQGAMPIVDVALTSGFAHQEHLSGVFRRFTGMTPAGYRRAVRN